MDEQEMSLPKNKQLRYIFSDVAVSPALFDILGTNLILKEKKQQQKRTSVLITPLTYFLLFRTKCS